MQILIKIIFKLSEFSFHHYNLDFKISYTLNHFAVIMDYNKVIKLNWMNIVE